MSLLDDFPPNDEWAKTLMDDWRKRRNIFIGIDRAAGLDQTGVVFWPGKPKQTDYVVEGVKNEEAPAVPSHVAIERKTVLMYKGMIVGSKAYNDYVKKELKRGTGMEIDVEDEVIDEGI